MLVAVTGGTGFVGSHTVAALRAAGHRVRLLVRDPVKLKRVLAPHGIGVEGGIEGGIEGVVEGDVTDERSVARLVAGCDALVHAAAVVALEAARADEVRRTNERGVHLAIGIAASAGLRRIVYVSSAGALFVPGGSPLSGSSPVGAPTSAYSESKARAEHWVREQQARGVPIQTVYPTAVVGPDDPGLSDPNRALSFFLAFGAVITSTGYQPVDVRDLARLQVALLESERPPGRYVATGPYLAWPELCERLERLTGRRLVRWRVPGGVLRGLGRAADVVKRVVSFDLPVTHEGMVFATSWPTADGTPAERELGIRYRDLDDTLADTLRWMCTAGHLTASEIGALASSAR